MKKIIDVRNLQAKPVYLTEEAAEAYCESHERPNDLIVEEVDW